MEKAFFWIGNPFTRKSELQILTSWELLVSKNAGLNISSVVGLRSCLKIILKHFFEFKIFKKIYFRKKIK
jgi:hypothetical protein